MEVRCPQCGMEHHLSKDDFDVGHSSVPCIKCGRMLELPPLILEEFPERTGPAIGAGLQESNTEFGSPRLTPMLGQNEGGFKSILPDNYEISEWQSPTVSTGDGKPLKVRISGEDDLGPGVFESSFDWQDNHTVADNLFASKSSDEELVEMVPMSRLDSEEGDTEFTALSAEESTTAEVNHQLFTADPGASIKPEPLSASTTAESIAPAVTTPSQDVAEEQPVEQDQEVTADPKTGTPLSGLLWLLLTIALLWGAFYQFRENIIPLIRDDPAFRPLVSTFCGFAECEVPVSSDISQLEVVVSRLDRTDTGLKISLNLINHAPFGQPYPDVTLSLNDASGKTLARRTYTAATYLPDDKENLIKSNKLSGVALIIPNPPAGAVGYDFKLLK